uniref:PLAC domain-containing protein n=1 Tax=Amphiprion ocellaris TaxID=80972 RepID=A0A3Q1C6Q7_AMPOC
MRLGLLFRILVLWSFVEVTTSVTKTKRKVSARRSRQVLEAEPAEGVWSAWGGWSECSQTCGVGVSQRSRRCLAPPQTPPLSPHTWVGYLPGGVRPAVVSPYYPHRYLGQHRPYAPPLPSNRRPGLPLYQNTPAGEARPLYRNTPAGEAGRSVPGQTNWSPPFYQPGFSPANQETVPVYQPPYRTPSLGYNQPGHIIRRPTNLGAARAGGGGARRSVSASREALTSRRSSPIRPGQFGYGRVPFSLPLHRPNRQARHTANGTANGTGPEEEEEEERGADKEEDQEEEVEAPTDTEPNPPTLTSSSDGSSGGPSRPDGPSRPGGGPGGSSGGPSSPQRPLLPAPPLFSRSSSPHQLVWSSIAPSPPPLPRPASPFSSPLHRPGPAGGVFPLQRPHLGEEPGREGGGASQVFRCSGPGKEHRRCFSQVCSGSSLDSRAEQCAAFNTQEFMGRLYNWEPFTEVGLDKQCELTCRPAGYRFYVRQAERVRDGTTCFNISINDVCVDGRCLTEGCDGVLGSDSVIDRCGVCGGHETSCRKVTGSFQNITVPLGYHKILNVPPGATFINITERRASPNYLAMRSGTGASVVNGRWAVDPPGDYEAGGTTFTYTRPRAQAEGEEEKGESLKAPGPTTALLQLYIIFHKENPGIDYEFYVPLEKKEERLMEREAPREQAREWPREQLKEQPRDREPMREQLRDREPARASLRSTSSQPTTLGRPPLVVVCYYKNTAVIFVCFSPSAGSQFRVVLCLNRHTDEEVPERKCDSAAKPLPEEEPCNTQPCPPFWEVSSWSECSVSCGVGVQQRQLQCRQSFGNRSTMVHPQRCAALTAPQSTQPCQLQLCSHWEVGSDWSSCSVDCGVGRRTRSVRCVSDQGSVVNDKECNSRLRPQGDEECNMGPCVTNWYFTTWSNMCSAPCGPGVQRREVVCLTRGGAREGGGGGDCVGEKPAEMKACNGGPCEPTATWYSSPWTQCNVLCGEGTQRRDIICVQKMGSDFTVAPAAECAHLDKPAAVQECEMGECRPQWFTTEWSTCSQSCGNGLQMREVRCLTPEKKHSPECDAETKPEQEQSCNSIPCSPAVADENCRDRRQNCVMVVQARLCVYSYYQAACCASCTHSAQIHLFHGFLHKNAGK